MCVYGNEFHSGIMKTTLKKREQQSVKHFNLHAASNFSYSHTFTQNKETNEFYKQEKEKREV